MLSLASPLPPYISACSGTHRHPGTLVRAPESSSFPFDHDPDYHADPRQDGTRDFGRQDQSLRDRVVVVGSVGDCAIELCGLLSMVCNCELQPGRLTTASASDGQQTRVSAIVAAMSLGGRKEKFTTSTKCPPPFFGHPLTVQLAARDPPAPARPPSTTSATGFHRLCRQRRFRHRQQLVASLEDVSPGQPVQDRLQ